ncbi:MAG: glycosyltransferase family 87 protein [Cyclobacteriaceae bacterium]|nr:glycosyltransferase family 87 protein [Cyclobacteriaceae bacterium]
MNRLKAVISYFSSFYKPIVIIYCVVVVAVSLQQLLSSDKVFDLSGQTYTEYNNYIIFKQAYFHLVDQKDLYSLYLNEQWDLFKYSPAFALFFGALAYLPDGLGLLGWNMLNAFCLFFAIKKLPNTNDKTKIAILFYVLIELVTSLQNSQSNALMAGLLILAFVFFETEKIFLACLCITLTVFIKIFGLVAFAIAIFYPNKIKTICYSVTCFIGFTFVPLVVIPIEQLIFLYKSWWGLLIDDHTSSYGLSMLGWLNTWFGFNGNKNLVVLIGLFVFLLPLIRVNEYKTFLFRVSFFCSLLIWMVIFNHKAESPTFIIAVSGIAIWYYFKSNSRWDEKLLIMLAFVFTCLSPTDLFSASVQSHFFDPYAIKVAPCIFVWFKITYDLQFRNFQPQLLE